MSACGVCCAASASASGWTSAWVLWTLSESGLTDYNLLSSTGTKSKRYFVSKQYSRYVRPEAVRVEASAANADVVPLVFVKDGLTTLVISNVGNVETPIQIKGDGTSTQYKVFRTSATENCEELSAVKTGERIVLLAQSIVTLVGVN